MGLLITIVAYTLVASGGVNSVKGMFVLIGVPVSIVMIGCFYASFKLCEQSLQERETGKFLRLTKLRKRRIRK